MEAETRRRSDVVPQAAFWTLFLFLLAVLGALAITLLSGSYSVRVLASAAVVPIVGLTVTFLHFERKNRRWSYLGAATLGVVGVTLRFVISMHPSLEVGGGLPWSVTVVYVSLGLAVAGTSVWSYSRVRRPPKNARRS